MPHWIALPVLLLIGATSARANAAANVVGVPSRQGSPGTTNNAPLVSPRTSPTVPAHPAPEIALGALQLVAGYAAEVGGVVGVFAIGLDPKNLGFSGDFPTLVEVVMLAPAFAAGAVCGTGLLSRSFRGRCSTTLLGSYVGAAAGALVGIAAASAPGPDDTSEFMQTISGIAGVFLFAPVGAVIGYHAGKEEVRPDAPTTTPPAPPLPNAFWPAERSRGFTTHSQARTMMLPIVNMTW